MLRIRNALLPLWLALMGLSMAAVAADNIPDPLAAVRSGKAPAASGAPAAAQPVVIPEPPRFDATAWVLMDYATGRVLFEHNSRQKIWPASLTKMMTSYVIGLEFKAGRLKYDDPVTITEDAWAKNYSDSSKMFIEVGKTIKAGDLNKGIIIQSGNDACVAMAIHLAGSQEGFVSVMNSYAQRMGLKGTHFANVHGLFNEQNYSTAMDMSEIGRHLIRDVPEEYSVYREKEFTFNGIRQYNRNRLLCEKGLNVDGIKTGHLSEVGYNLVASAEQNGMRLIATVIGARSEKDRINFCRQMLNYGFSYFEPFSPLQANMTILTREVRMGDRNEIDLVLPEDLALIIPRGSRNDIAISYELDHSTYKAPLKAGEKLGTIKVTYRGQIIQTAPLVAREDVGEGGFFGNLWDRTVMFFSGDDEAPRSQPAQDGSK